MRNLVRVRLGAAILALALPCIAYANTTPHTLSLGSFAQAWSNTGLITTTDNWVSVPSIVGYRGDGLTAATGVDPQTMLTDGSATPVDVNANQTNPDTFTTGGVAEF